MILRLSLLLPLAALTACGPDAPRAPSAGPAPAQVVFDRGNFSEPDTLDPHRSEETGSAEILRDLYEGLVSETATAELTPGVAESWSVSEDGRRYTFELRPDARWSNGDAVVAADFVAGLRRTVDPATASTYAQILYPIVNAEAITSGRAPPESLGVRALDESRLEIELRSPTPYFLQLLTHPSTMPLHRASYETHGDTFTRPGRHVGNGAYRLVDWVVNSHVELEKNPYYWRDDVEIDRVFFHNTEDVNAELTRYRAGELDFTYQIPASQVGWIHANLGEELRVSPRLSTYFFGFDLTEPPFDDARVRQALAMTLDREIMTGQVTRAGELPAYGLVPPGVAGYESAEYPWRSLPRDERIRRARELMAAAGYTDARPLRAELRYNTSANHEQIAVAAAAMWKQALGAEVSLVNEEWKVLLQTRQDPARWDMLRYAWVGDYNDAYTFLEIFQTGHGQNFTGYSSADYDALVARAAAEADPEARAAAMHEAEQVLIEDYAFVPVYFYVNKHLVKPYVEGYVGNVMDHNLTRHYRLRPH